jgi:small subunit ribosomal protein S6e
MEVRLCIGDPKAGKTAKAILTEDQARPLMNHKVGDKIHGHVIGYEGYEFEISGGSDYCGFPMRRDVIGTARKRILIVSGTGLRKNEPGRKVRKSVAGNTIYANTAQVNLKVLKHGAKPLFEEAPKAEEAKAE